MSAVLSLLWANCVKMKSVSDTSGIVTSGYGVRKIMSRSWSLGLGASVPVALASLSGLVLIASAAGAPVVVIRRAVTIHDSADQTAAKMYIGATSYEPKRVKITQCYLLRDVF